MLLVDCYNLLHAPMPPCLAGLEENRLCHLLARGPWKRKRILVVCDGAPKPHLPHSSPVPQVQLLYAGKGQSADDVIHSHIQAHSTPRRLVVVSSDREIQKAARRRRAVVHSAADFIHILAGLASQPSQPAAPSPLEQARHSPALGPDAIDAWAQTFGVNPQAPLHPPKKPSPKRPSR